MSVPPPALDDSTTTGSNTRTAGLTAAEAASAGTATSAGASTTGPLTQEATAAPEKSGSKAPLALGVAAAIALAGAGIWAMTRGPSEEETTPAPAATESAPPEPTTEPTETAEATPPPAPEPEPKRVKVVIIPSDSKVEVEGEVADTKDGLLELEGKPGKVFKVRAFKGPSETEAEVVITESGALPPKIEVKIGQKLKIPRGGLKPEKAGGTGDAPPPPALPPSIKTDTDEFD
jgi:serine/threonine-protein kinase